MCGIWGYVQYKKTIDLVQLFNSFMKVQPRGPDRSDFKMINEFISLFLGFHRLAIMDKSNNGDQPFTTNIDNRSIYSVCNGEIYNYKELIINNGFTMKSRSDCEVLPHLYVKYGKDMLKLLRGEFALCIIDIDHSNDSIKIMISRDPTGVRPVFVGQDENGFAFSSVLSGLVNIVDPKSIRQLWRAEIYNLELQMTDQGLIISTCNEKYHDLTSIPRITYHDVHEKIRDTLIESVKCRLESDRPLGALLSGGLDSSLVCSIASYFLKDKLRTFSIGIPGSTDKEYAEMVAKHCGTIHTHVEFTQQEFLDALPEVIRITETHDITSVRASTGQYLICKWIRENTDIKVLLIGDGSDELCAGYMYFHNAPSSEELHQENIRLLEDIQYYDSLRADRCIAGNGIEARVPFLDNKFVELYLSIDPEIRAPQIKDGRKVEKYLLRKSFDTDYEGRSFLPEQVLWRKKEAFSDGVSSREKSWYQIIQESVEDLYNEKDFEDETVNYHIKPTSKEALHYRKYFNQYFHYGAAGVIPYYWLPKWSGNITDPSARVLKVYNED